MWLAILLCISINGSGVRAANITKSVWCSCASDFYMIEAKPENLIGDRAYDSDPLDEELRRDGIEMILPHLAARRARRIKGG